MPPPKDPETGRFLPKREGNEPIGSVLREMDNKSGKPKEEDEPPPERKQAEAHSYDRQEGREAPKEVKAKAEPRRIQSKAAKEEEPEPEIEPEVEGEEPPAEPAAGEAEKSFFEGLMGKEKKAAKEKEGEPAKGAKPAAAKKAAAPAAKPAAAAKPEMSAADIAAAAADAAVRASEERAAARETKIAVKPADEGPQLPAAEQRKLKVLERMEKMYPENAEYKGLAKKYKDSLIAFSQYADKWEKDNPGQEFNEADEEHRDALKKINVDWEDIDFQEALADIRSEVRLAEKSREENSRLSKLERAEKLRQETPRIQADSRSAAYHLVEEHFKEEWPGFFDEAGHINTEAQAEFEAENPIQFKYRMRAFNDIQTEARTIHTLFSGLTDLDAKNPIHAEVDRFTQELDARLAKSRPQNADGQTFAPLDEYSAMDAAKRKRHWTLSADDVIQARAKFLAKEADEIAAQEQKTFDEYAKSRGMTEPERRPNAERKPTNQPARKPVAEPEAGERKPNSPSAAVQSRSAAMRDRQAADREKRASSFVNDI